MPKPGNVGVALSAKSTSGQFQQVLPAGKSPSVTPGVDNQGWWSSNVTFHNDPANDNYHTGTAGAFGGDDTFRSFFSFDLAGVSGVVTAAEFDVRRYDQSGPVSLNLWDVTTPASTLITKNNPNASIFPDLGSGASYGVFSVATGASTDVLQFTLNAAALANINSQLGAGYFSIGASISGGGDIFSSSNEEPGNSSCLSVGTSLVCPGGGPLNSTQNLVLQVTPATVPEPPSLLLFAIGLAGLGFSRRSNCSRRRATLTQTRFGGFVGSGCRLSSIASRAARLGTDTALWARWWS